MPDDKQHLHHQRMSIGGAHHMCAAGHITPEQRDACQAKARAKLAAAAKRKPAVKPKKAPPAPPPPPPFGSLGGAGHYMSTVNPGMMPPALAPGTTEGQ